MLVKRYSNRKMYHIESRRYVTMDEVEKLVQTDEDLQVLDYETGKDITVQILVQILLHQEKSLGSLFPKTVLIRLIQLGSRKMIEVRRCLYAFLEPEKFVNEEIKARLHNLTQWGYIDKEESEHLSDLLLWMDNKSSNKGDGFFSGVNRPASQKELKMIQQRISRLETQLDTIQKVNYS